jgi:predicted O-methyltransferase YrrM
MNNKKTLYIMRDSRYQQGLKDLIKYVNSFSNTKEMTMIEIGSYAGESTEIFAQNFKQVIAIDPFQNDYDPNDITCNYMDLTDVYYNFISVIENYENITHIRKTSDDAIEDLKNHKVDFIYIDGLHTYEQVKKDIANYKNLLKENGFISGHDYHEVWKGVVNAINESLGKPDNTFSDTSWIKKINN